MQMLKQDPTREPNLKMPEQPMLPFEQSVPADSNDEPEIEPCEVWEALPRAMKTEVHRDCLRTMREVIGDGSQ
jgi:hypothetical protein